MIQYKIGNILDATEDAIAHQTNCVTYVAAGLAKSLFERFSYADCYSDRVKMDDPGTVTMCGGHDGLKTIINMHAQRYPGKPQYDKSRRNDGMIDRCTWFRQCLEQVIQLFSGEEPLLHSIAFPAGIGVWSRWWSLADIPTRTSDI